MRALHAGRYVFLEKPIAMSFKEAGKLARAADKAPRRLYFRHNRRFEPTFNQVQEIIASGILGEVYEIKLNGLEYLLEPLR